MSEIDRLEIQIESEATKANKQLDTLSKKLKDISVSLGAIQGGNLASISSGIEKLSTSISELKGSTKSDFNRIAKGLQAFENVKTTGIDSAKTKTESLGNSVSEATKKFRVASKEINEAFQLKIGEAGKSKQFTGTYEQLQAEIKKTEEKIVRLKDKQQDEIALENTAGKGYVRLLYNLSKASNWLDILNKKQAEFNNISAADSQNFTINDWRFPDKQFSANGSFDNAMSGYGETEEEYDARVKEIMGSLGVLEVKAQDVYQSIGLKTQETTEKTVSLKDSINNAFHSIGNLFSKISSSGSGSIAYTATEEYQNLAKEIGIAEQALERLYTKRERFESIGTKTSSQTFKGLQYDIETAEQKLNRLNAAMDSMKTQNENRSVGVLSNAFSKLNNRIFSVDNRMKSKNKTLSDQTSRTHKESSAVANLGNKFKALGAKILFVLTPLKLFHRHSDGSNNSTSKLVKSIFKLSNMFKLLVLRMAMRQVIQSAIQGFQNLAQYSNKVNTDLSLLLSRLIQLKNSFATAFAPILSVITPYLDILISKLIQVNTVIAKVFAALTGQDTVTIATKVNEDYAASLDTANSSAKSLQKTLASFDEINDIGQSSNGSSGSGSTVSPEDMFDTVPVESEFKNLAEQIKDLFKPIQDSWDKYGTSTVDSIKYAFTSIKDLAVTIGSSWKEVWINGTGETTCNNILIIVSAISGSIGNIASNFKTAWKNAGTGTSIVQTIADIINDTLGHVSNITKEFEKWTSNIDFGPLLKTFDNLVEALRPLNNFVWSGLESLFANVLLPLADWTIGEGLPRLNQIFADFMNDIDFDSLSEAFNNFSKAIAPFAKAVGTGIIDFFDDLMDFGADFINAVVPGGLNAIANALNGMDPNTISDLAYNLTALATALALYKGLTGVAAIVTGIKTSFEGFIGLAGLGTFAENIATLSTSLGTFANSPAIQMLAADLIDSLEAAIKGALGERGGEIFEQITSALGGSVVGIAAGAWAGPAGMIIGGLVGALCTVDIDGKAIGTHILDGIKSGFNAIFNWDTTLALFDDMIGYFGDIANGETWLDIGANIVKGLGVGIEGALYFVLEPFIDLGNALINGIKDLFGIHSPSTVMAEIGGYIVEGLWNGISDMWTSFADFVAGLPGKIIDKFKDIKESFKTKGGDIVKGIKSGYNDLSTDFGEWLASKKESVATSFGSLKEKFKTKGGQIISGIKSGWSDGLTSFSTWLGGLKDNVSSGFGTLKDKFSTKGGQIISGIKSGWTEKWSNFKEWLSNLPEKIYDGIGSLKEKGKSLISSFIDGFKSLSLPKIKLSITYETSGLLAKACQAIGLEGFPKMSLSFYANGGFPNMGEMFVARENGPELVGKMGSSSVVANNDQIVEGIKQGVYEAMMAAGSGGLNASTIYQAVYEAMSNANIKATVGEDDVFNANRRKAKEFYNQTGGLAPFPT